MTAVYTDVPRELCGVLTRISEVDPQARLSPISSFAGNTPVLRDRDLARTLPREGRMPKGHVGISRIKRANMNFACKAKGQEMIDQRTQKAEVLQPLAFGLSFC